MASERSFEDRKQKALDLKGAITNFAPAYEAEDPAFTVVAFTAAIAAATAANTAVDDAKQPWENAVAQRKAAVDQLMPLVTHSLAYVESKTVWKDQVEVVKRAADKVRGHTKKKPKTPPPTENPTPAAEKKREQGERSYMEIAEAFRQYISRLTKLTGYAPSSAAITLASLNALKTTLDGLNTSIPDLSQDLTDAQRARKRVYDNKTGLHFVFNGVKKAVKAQYGQNSDQFAQVTLIQW